MNQEASEYLEKIVAKEPHELVEEEIAFLRARRDYLSDEQVEKFAEFLTSDEETESKAKSKKSKDK